MRCRITAGLVLAVCVAAVLGIAGAPAQAETCSAVVSGLNFGSVSVRAGATNSTSGSVQVSCSGVLVGVEGICLRFGPGSGGAGGGNSPRYMRRGDGAALAYELRSGGNGSAFGTLNSLYLTVPIVLGSGTATASVFGDITSASVGVGTGSYQSQFSGGANIEMSYGVASCAILGTTVAVPAFSVSATVVPSCEVDVTALDFGYIPAILSQAADAAAQINVRCTASTSYQVTLDQGTGAAGSDPAQRRMKNGSRTLTYGLFRDAGRSQPWGTGGTAVSGTGAGANQALPVYGRIYSGQTAATGVYTDSVVVTVIY